ncbi:MAG TPA: hypothetical protein VM427_08875 [Patescibacteria group bacterium]|nr:hypothetical protein [Patescibacteria group bacterium]
MAHPSTDRSVGRRSGGDKVAADPSGTFEAGEGVVGASLAMTPAAALARHVEWLDFALGAATAEEHWRRERLAKATKGNRAKRTDRLAEVVAEIEELTALLTGIRDLEQRATPAPATTPRRRGRPPGSKNGTGRRSTSAPRAASTAPVAAPAAAKPSSASAPATGRRRPPAAKAPAPSERAAAGSAAAAPTAKPTGSPARRRPSTSTTGG